MTAFLSRVRRSKSRRGEQAFTLIELILAAVLGAVVIGGLGSSLLLSEVRLSRNGIAALNQGDDITQAANLILDELASSSFVDTTGTWPSTGCNASITPLLVLKGNNNNWTTYYGIRSVAAGSTDWFGPNRLVRCGSTFSNSGQNTAGAVSESVVLDRLPAANSLVVSLNTSATNTLRRQAEITLTTQIGTGPSVTRTFQALSPINRTYSLYDLILNNNAYCTAGATVCNTTVSGPSTQKHWRPGTTSTLNGDPTLEDIAYFPGNQSQYTLTRTSSGGICTREACYVSGGPLGNYAVTLNYFNVIAFSDAEVRL